MYAGHFAIGLAIRARHPQLPAMPVLLGVVFFDLLAAAVALVGMDAWRPPLGDGLWLFMSTTIADGLHSLVAACVWAAAWGLLFWRRRVVAVWAALAAFSHFLFDWPLHFTDLSTHPHAATHLALGAGRGFGPVQWIFEGVVVVVALGYAAWVSRGRAALHPLAGMIVLLAYAALSPQLPWMQALAQWRSVAPPVQVALWGIAGYAGMALLLALLLKREQGTGS